VLDVGTGTGAIALAIADEHPGARVTAIDASEDALALARENAARTGLPVELVRHDLREGLPGGPYELVVSNPPYVEAEELTGLQPEVRDWEPREALVGEGMTAAVARGAREVLRAGGWLVLEVADGSAARVSSLLASLGFDHAAATADLAGRDRVVEGQWA
jgi:release factor glutamine methyltransferase